MDLKYDKYGKGYPILFLHGFNITPDNHVNYLRKIGEHYEVIAPYLTDIKPNCSSLQEYTDLTKTFIKHHKLDQYSTIGYSLGGAISFELADSKLPPEALIGLAPLMPVSNGTIDFIVQGLKMCYNEMKDTNTKNYKDQFKMVNTIVGNCLSNPQEFYNSVHSFSNYTLNDKLIMQPTQIVLGKNDEFFNKDTMSQSVYDHFTDLQMIELFGVNHNILSNPEQVSALNLEFLEDVLMSDCDMDTMH